MKRNTRRRWWAIIAIAICCVLLVAAWQWQALARFALVAGAEAFAHVRLSFTRAEITASGANFTDVRVTSLRNEPIAEISRLDVAYNLRDLLPGGHRLYGLKSVDVQSPHLTIVRHPDGTYNLPIPRLTAAKPHAGPPLIAAVRVRNGSLDVIDESTIAPPQLRHLQARSVEVNAGIATNGRSSYRVALRYGEGGPLYPLAGDGVLDFARGFVNQHWTAAHLPVAGAVDFALHSPTLRLQSGMLNGLDARSFAIGEAAPYFAASAVLRGGRIAIAGLATPVTGVAGPIDVYGDGILTPDLHASLAGVPASISGGVYNLTRPRLRVAVRGSGDLARLRTVFAQARRFPVHGPIAFGLLVEGDAHAPLIWIALHSPQTTYAATTLHDVDGLVAFDGRQAQIVRFTGGYSRVRLQTSGRVAMTKQPKAVELLVQADAPAGGAPYLNTLLPEVPLHVGALATATDPKALALRGALWGTSNNQSLAAIFNVDQRGNGTIGPLYARSGSGTLYARIALARSPHDASIGLIEARNLPVAAAKGVLNGVFVGRASASTIAVTGNATLSGSFGGTSAHGSVAVRGGALRGRVFGDLASRGSFGALLGGTLRAPTVNGTVVIAGKRYRNFTIDGSAGLTYQNGTLDVHDAAVAVGPLFVGVAGTINGLMPRGTFAPRYDLAAQLHSSDVGEVVAIVAPQRSGLVQGSIDADLRVRGTGGAAAFSGRVSAPEGSVNGLNYRDFAGIVSGDAGDLSVSNGRVVVGSSAIALSANVTRAGAAVVAVSAPHLDLADLNDFFDTGDTFAGTGALALRASVVGTHIRSTSGDANFSNARYRRVALGTVSARWSSAGDSIATAFHFGGPTGQVSLNGTVVPATRSLDVRAQARGLDLSTWLPMLGFNVPVTGRLDAQTSLAGTYPDLAMRLHAALSDATAGRMPIERFEIAASAMRDHGTIDSAVLDVPSMHTVASGSFGLRLSDPFALAITSTSEDLGDFLARATGHKFAIDGRLSSALHVEGTLEQPRLRDTIVLAQLRYGALTIPRIAAEIDADRHRLAIQNGEVDLNRGKALLAASLPIALHGSHVAAAGGAISATLTAQGIALANFGDLLPKGSQLSGDVNGTITARGTTAAPNIDGSLSLADGSFSGPMERTPITGIAGTLTFAGTRAQLESRAFAGNGKLTAAGDVTLADLRHPADATFALNAAASNVRLDLPQYFTGDLNGALTFVHRTSGLPEVGGDLAISNARLPLSAFLTLNKGGGKGTPLPNIAFDGLNVSAGSNVRVQSANVDIGTTGALRLGGTLAAPALTGSFRSTGGSLSFYRAFNIERGTVRFESSTGVIPDVDAVATTLVPNPPTAIRLHVTGPVTNLNLALASDPSYSRTQILGILVGAQQFGAVQGVQSTGGGAFSAGSAARSLALGQLNTAFTRTVLEPLSTSVGNALGFSEVQLSADVQSGLGVSAVKAFGKYVSAIFQQTFGYPQTQSIALEAHPNDATGLRLTAFTSVGPTLFALQQPQPVAGSALNVNPATSFVPLGPTNGVTFSYVRRWW